MRVEQEQKVTEDARRFAEQDAAAQRYAAQVLQVLFLPFSHLWYWCITKIYKLLKAYEHKLISLLMLWLC